MKRVEKGKYLKFTIYCIVVVLLNIAGVTLFFRVDLTKNRVYSLSSASKKVVSTLSEPLTVKVFFNSNLPAPYNNTERYLHDLLEEYAIAGNRYFNYQFYDVSGEKDEDAKGNQELARSYGIQPVQIQNIEQDEVKFQKAYMGMALIHGDMIETLPTITSTDQLEYQITSAVRKMNNKISALMRLKDTISVKLILSSSLRVVGPYMNISGLLELPSRIEEIVKKLNAKDFGKLTFYNLDPSTSPDAEREAQKYHVLRLNWDEFKDRRGRTVPADSGYAGIVVEHGNRFESIELIEVIRLPIFGTQYQLADMEDLDKRIDGALESVIHINEEIGYLAGHGTPPIAAVPPMMGQPHQQESLSSLNKLLSGEYSIQQVALNEGDTIPEGFTTLIIAGPKENFSDYELYQIDQYLMKGKNLALFIDAFNEVTPQGQQGMMNQLQKSYWLPLHTGLEKLLARYGVSVRDSIILDENCFKQKMPRQFGGGEQPIYFAPIIKNEMINKKADYLANIKGLVMLQSSPVDVNEQTVKENSLKAVRLFSSSDKSWEMKERINLNPMFISPPRNDEKFESLPLAYMVEGAFPSYFADKPVPERKKEEAPDAAEEEKKDKGADMSAIRSEGETIKKGKEAKIFIIGTSEILKDNVIDEEGKTPNAQFVMNVIDYLNNREDIAIMRSKTQRFNPLAEVSPGIRTAVKSLNIAGLPILVVIAGVIVWGRRASRKRMIQKIFSR